MNVVDTARSQVKQIVEKVAEKVAHAAATDSRVQAITIGRPRADVIALLCDAERLSQVFGDIAEVQESARDRLRWTFLGEEGSAWDCVVSVEGDRLRYVDANPDKNVEVVFEFRDAPRDRGTEVISRATAPMPGVLTGLLIYKALYRARALLQTGEVPTITRNTAARNSAR
jgi:uncharacterized membrane protein